MTNRLFVMPLRRNLKAERSYLRAGVVLLAVTTLDLPVASFGAAAGKHNLASLSTRARDRCIDHLMLKTL
jgi:hypothetical protein